MYQKATVAVRRSGARVDVAESRPIRVCPDGTSGVVYAGDVYSLRKDVEGEYIALEDSAFPKERCSQFLRAEEARVYSAVGTPSEPALSLDRWSVESNKYGHYVVFDASEAAAETLVDHLDAEGIGVRRWGPSVRSAADGHFYDWFIRLGASATRDRAIAAVEEALSTDSSAVEPAGSDEEMSALVQQVLEMAAHAQGEIASIRAELGEISAESTALGDENASLTADIARLERERAALTARLEQATRRAEELESARAPGPTVADAAQLSIALERARDAEDEWVTASCRVDELEQTNTELRMRCEVLEREAVSLRGSQERRAEEVGETRERAVRAIAAPSRSRAQARRDAPLRELVWKRLVLDETAVGCFVDRQGFDQPYRLLRALVRLDESDEVVGKKLSGHPRWWEVRVNTGTKSQEDMGRIYYQDQPDGRRWVFAHRKVNSSGQDRFIEAMVRKDYDG